MIFSHVLTYYAYCLIFHNFVSFKCMKKLFLISFLICFTAQIEVSAAPFVTVTAIPGKVSGIVSDGSKIFVSREDFPSILIYDGMTGTLDAEASLLLTAQFGAPTGVTALTITRDSKVLVASIPFGEIFLIENSSAISKGILPSPELSETITLITAIYSHNDGTVYFGGRSFWDTSEAHFFRMAPNGSPSGATRIKLLQDSVINSINGFGRTIAIGTRDTSTPHSGRIYLYDTITQSLTHIYTGDSEVSAVGATTDTLFFISSPSGFIRKINLSIVTNVPDTMTRSTLFGFDGKDTVLFLAADTQVLFAFKDNTIKRYGVVNSAFTQIRAMATVTAPLRHYGVARGAANSYLFYYDTFVPWVESLTFEIDTGLRQPGTSDTFFPPLTRGLYTLRIKTNEILSAVPKITLIYSNGAMQNITMNGAGRDFSGSVEIDSSRPEGNVSITFIGVDDAGNTGTAIITGQIFELKNPGRIAIAKNVIRPNFGEFMTVRYFLLKRRNVSVKVYNMRGQMVADISPGYRDPGEYEDVKWNGRNTKGELVASGMYLLRFDAGEEYRLTGKVMVIR